MANKGWVIVMTATVIMTAPAAVRGASGGEGATARRLQVSVGPIGAQTLNNGTIQVSTSGRMPESALLHGFRVELVDASGTPISSAAAWEVDFLAGTSNATPRMRSFVQLTATACDIRLPRPLGYRLEPADSFVVTFRINGQVAEQQGIFARMTIDYEALDGALSRLAVLPLPATRMDTLVAANAQSWMWQPEISGRMLVLTGAALESALDLVLEDVTTGVVLWRKTNRNVNGGFSQAGQIERLGVTVSQGGHYRLTARYAATPPVPGNCNAALFALVLPGARN